MAKLFSIFPDERTDHSKMVNQLLSNQVPAVPAMKPVTARPVSASANARSHPAKSKATKAAVNVVDEINKTSREDLILEIQEQKKKCRSLEESLAFVRAENQRLESESSKQQKRIDQLLNLAEGAKNVGLSSEIRRDIEKSILVRQLKNQINILRNECAEKESVVEALKRSTKSSVLSELQVERDEFSHEVQRLRNALLQSREDLQREKQRREWNLKVAGDTSDDLRKEVARLSVGYQNILANISNRGVGVGAFPSSTTAVVRPNSSSSSRSSGGAATNRGASDATRRPQSALQMNGKGSDSAPPADPLDSFGNGPTNAAKQLISTDNLVDSLLAEVLPQTQAKVIEEDNICVHEIGSAVEGLFKGGDSWYPGKITGFDKRSGMYSVIYDDGDEELDMSLSRLRIPSPHQPTGGSGSAAPNAPIRPLAPAPASHPALLGGSLQQSKTGSAAVTLNSQFKVGDKVESLYYKGSTWYGGKVRVVHPVLIQASASSSSGNEYEFLYDVDYDDGDRELKVPAANVRFVGGKETEASAPIEKKASAVQEPAPIPEVTPAPLIELPHVQTSSAPNIQPKFTAGHRVDAQYRGGVDWYEGAVKTMKLDESTGSFVYEILYDDGDREVNVPEIRLRTVAGVVPPASNTSASNPPVNALGGKSPTSTNQFKKDDKVQGYFKDMQCWYDGVVVQVHGDTNSYHILYDDGDEEYTVQASRLRLASQSTSSAAKFKVGDKVEGKYGTGDAWYPATVEREVGLVYSLLYEDGDKETEVPESNVRHIAAPLPSSASTASAIQNTGISTARKTSVVSTNLDSFLNELSDDDGGELDAGKGVTLPQTGFGEEELNMNKKSSLDGYDEDFDA